MEAGDVIIIDEPKKRTRNPKKKEGEERTVIIYKLEITGTNFLYVGHTENFKQRVDNHRTACRANLEQNPSRNGKCLVYSEINRNGGWEKVTMTPVEEFVSKNKVQSRIREQYWIDKIQVARRDAVMMNSYISPEQKAKYYEENKDKLLEQKAEYHQANREKILEQHAEHYQANKDKILERISKRMTCPCGVQHRAGDKSRHLKSAKHIKWERDIDQKFNDRLDKEMNELIENNV